MTALAFDFDAPPAARSAPASRPAPAPRSAPAPGPALALVPAPTLDAVLTGAWSSLREGFAACPVCHEQTMTARWTRATGSPAAAAPAAARPWTEAQAGDPGYR
jgi:hypothetical protein